MQIVGIVHSGTGRLFSLLKSWLSLSNIVMGVYCPFLKPEVGCTCMYTEDWSLKQTCRFLYLVLLVKYSQLGFSAHNLFRTIC